MATVESLAKGSSFLHVKQLPNTIKFHHSGWKLVQLLKLKMTLLLTNPVHIFQWRSLTHFLKCAFKIFIMISGLTKAKIF